MRRVVLSSSEDETQAAGSALANELFASRPCFVHLQGDVGAGKTAFARGFIRAWSALAKDPEPENITSPTYNIVKVYGKNAPLAHLDLYRVKHIEELSQIGFEHYFFELSCCIVEWLEQIPEAQAAKPPYTAVVQIKFSEEQSAQNMRELTIELPKPKAT